MTQPSLKSCPCGSDISFDACCQPYHQGPTLPPTPEALMRSRYTAFALNQRDYLLATWHPSTRPQQLPADPDTRWVALEIIAAPPVADDQGTVHFRATFREPGGWHVLEEVSRFVREEGRWWYVDGKPSVTRLKPRRNEPCPCGSGRKLKVCCKA